MLAHDDDDEDGDGDTPPSAVVDEDTFEDDVEILNYALTLEFLEAEFYDRALDNLDESDLLAVSPVEDLDAENRDRIVDDLEIIRDQEETHAETLESVVEDLGEDPVAEPDFEFGSAVTDAEEFLATAAVLEDTGVAAYAGAAPAIEDPDLVPPALSIHSVEGRHASFVRTVGGEVGFPAAFDQPLPPETVRERAAQFIADD
ncbi:ferritin-like domain-containing protein [Halorientalis halophila]|uniref:ferritin-like domain-containing protein n=1 Tax=Halorientalis halophila TaxID=3108499 RepID=UPI00300B8079